MSAFLGVFSKLSVIQFMHDNQDVFIAQNGLPANVWLSKHSHCFLS